MLQFIDACIAAENSNSLGSFLRAYPPLDFVARRHHILHVLPALGKAFDRGLISCARLVEVLAPPYLKLACSMRRDRQHESQALDALSEMFINWKAALVEALAGEMKKDSQGEWCTKLILQPQKREELLKALVANRFPEVRVSVIHFAGPVIDFQYWQK